MQSMPRVGLGRTPQAQPVGNSGSRPLATQQNNLAVAPGSFAAQRHRQQPPASSGPACLALLRATSSNLWHTRQSQPAFNLLHSPSHRQSACGAAAAGSQATHRDPLPQQGRDHLAQQTLRSVSHTHQGPGIGKTASARPRAVGHQPRQLIAARAASGGAAAAAGITWSDPTPGSNSNSSETTHALTAGVPANTAAQGYQPDTKPLPPLPRPAGRFNMPNTAPLTWGFMIAYLVFMLIVPIVALLVKASQTPLGVFTARALDPVAVHAYFVSFSCALAAALINCVFGFLLAWVLVRYDFPGKKIIDAAVDLPFALPTSVAGLTLATVYSDETILGQFLEAVGLPVVFTRLGVALAMVFVSFPFVVRTMQPVLQEMQPEIEEAAYTLGATPWKTFTQVLLPPLLPPLLTGTALAFSRALGEFGSIVIISSNFAFKDLIAPVLIFQCLEQYDFTGATIIGTVLLGISLVIMLFVNWVQTLSPKTR